VTLRGRHRPCLVVFHAHPDDEAIFTGGTIAMAVAARWRVVLVVATSGEEGAKPDWLTDELGPSRRSETRASAQILGIERTEFFGYRDSGTDSSPNRGSLEPDGLQSSSLALHAAPLHECVERLRQVIDEERPAALTSYDPRGIYGHPDHVRVHDIASAAVVGTECDLYEATICRRTLRRLRDTLVARGLQESSWPQDLTDSIGTDERGVLVTLDVSPHIRKKRAAIAAHASQVVEASSFMGLPPGAFHRLLETEWFIPVRSVDGRMARLLATAGSSLRSATHDIHNSGLPTLDSGTALVIH